MSDELLTPAEIEALLGSSIAAAASHSNGAASELSHTRIGDNHGAGCEVAGNRARHVVEEGDQLQQSRSERKCRNRLWAIHEQAARAIGAALSAMLCTPVDVRLRGIDRAECDELERDLAASSGMAVLRSTAIPGQLPIDISAAILVPMLERMVGSDMGATQFSERALSGVEKQLALRLVDYISDQLTRSWETVCPIGLQVDRLATETRGVSLGPPGSTALVVAFDTRLGTLRGEIRFCIPPHLSDVLDEKVAAAGRSVPLDYSRFAGAVATHPNSAELTVELTPAALSQAELAALSPGDVVTTDHLLEEPVLISIDGEPAADGELAATTGRKAIRVLRPRLADSRESPQR